MSDYQIVRNFIAEEERRRVAYYRYRPMERGPAMRRVADVRAALERLRVKAEWKAAGKWWQQKFD